MRNKSIQLLSRSAVDGMLWGVMYVRGEARRLRLPDCRLGPYLCELVDAATVIDESMVDYQTGAMLCWFGPRVDLLKDYEQGDFPEATDTLFAGLNGEQTVEAVKSFKPGWRKRGYVSLAQYVDTWRAAGARIGKRVGDVVQWEDGEVEEIIDPTVVVYTPRPCDKSLA